MTDDDFWEKFSIDDMLKLFSKVGIDEQLFIENVVSLINTRARLIVLERDLLSVLCKDEKKGHEKVTDEYLEAVSLETKSLMAKFLIEKGILSDH